MLRFKRRALMAMGIVGFVGMVRVLVALDVVPYAFAFPLPQFPTNSVTIVSDPPPPDLPGQFSEVTLLQDNLLDPGGSTAWRSANFDDSGWLASYPVVTQPAWGPPLGGMAPPADFIWGGSPGAAVGDRFNIPTSPGPPQFLFLRKNFCIPINASRTSIAAVTPLRLQVATDRSFPLTSASVYYNNATIATGLSGFEDGTFYSLGLAPALVNGARRVGRNTLAMRVRDDLSDTSAGVAYHLQFNYAIDNSAITVNSTPPSPSVAGTTVVFNQSNNGLSGDGPFTFGWDFGDGTTSTDPAPSKVYSAPGTYRVTLVMTDSLGCPSAPVSVQYVVRALAPTPEPPSDSEPDAPPPPPPTNTPVPSPTVTPTPTPEILTMAMLPETGSLDQSPFHILPFSNLHPFLMAGGILLLIAAYFLLRRYTDLSH